MAEGQDAANKITITVKTPKSKESITVDENAEIKDVSKLEWKNRCNYVICSGDT